MLRHGVLVFQHGVLVLQHVQPRCNTAQSAERKPISVRLRFRGPPAGTGKIRIECLIKQARRLVQSV